MQARKWCDICRGPDDGELKKCSTCEKRFHRECVYGTCTTKRFPSDWDCSDCVANEEKEKDDDDEDDNHLISARTSASKIKVVHSALRNLSCSFFKDKKSCFKPFIPADRMKSLTKPKTSAKNFVPLPLIQHREDYILAELRSYQQVCLIFVLLFCSTLPFLISSFSPAFLHDSLVFLRLLSLSSLLPDSSSFLPETGRNKLDHQSVQQRCRRHPCRRNGAGQDFAMSLFPFLTESSWSSRPSLGRHSTGRPTKLA